MTKRAIKKSEVKKPKRVFFSRPNKLCLILTNQILLKVIFFKLRIYGVVNPGIILTSWQNAVSYVIWNLGLCLSSGHR